MTLGWVLWVIGVIIAIIIGVSVFANVNISVVMDPLAKIGVDTTKALFASIILLVIAKLT